MGPLAELARRPVRQPEWPTTTIDVPTRLEPTQRLKRTGRGIFDHRVRAFLAHSARGILFPQADTGRLHNMFIADQLSDLQYPGQAIDE